MVDMDASSSVDGLKHPIENNIIAMETENKDVEHVNIPICGEPEEGQIIEDVEFEDISSDEDPIVFIPFTEADELSMRKRIEELELRNAELEKIAVISVINNYDVGSNKNVPQSENQPLDVIELSDYDEYSEYTSNDVTSAFIPYDSKYNVLKNYYKKIPKTAPDFSSSATKAYHRSRKRRRRAHSSENRNADENKSTKISRVKKRRKRSHSSSLDFSSIRIKSAKHHQSRSKRSKRKRRLKNQHYGSVSLNDSDSEKSEIFELNREELRKAIKRNSETIHKGNLQNIVGSIKDQITIEDDVIEIENDNEVEIINSTKDEKLASNAAASDDSDSLEEQTLRLIALKSAIVKKHLDRKKRREIDEKKPYSPSDFDYWCSGMNIENSPKDFDEFECIESNNISPSESPINISDEDNMKTGDIDLINVDTDSNEPRIQNTPEINFPSIDILKKLAPPPPQFTILSPAPVRLKEKCFEDSQNGDESKLIISRKNSSPDDLSDEEELALRALLLSTMNSPKVNNIAVKKTILTDNSQNTVLNKNSEPLCKCTKLDKIENSHITLNEEKNEDTCNMDSYEITSQKTKNTTKTESLLKEAVKRLKTTTLNDLSENELVFETNSFVSQNKTDRSLKYSVPDNKNSFKEIQTSGQEISIENVENMKSKELLNESRRKLNKFIQCFGQEKSSISDNEQDQSSGDVSDLDDIEQKAEINNVKEIDEKLTSKSCIETLQKIIELNYEKLVRMSPEDHKINTENKEQNGCSNSLTEAQDVNQDFFTSSNEKSFCENYHSKMQTSNLRKSEDNVDENVEDVQANFLDPENRIIEKNIEEYSANLAQQKVDTSLEIKKKIESLQKLSDSIEQTTKITAKAKASLDVSKPQSINTNSLVSSNSIQNRKIIKINKIINQTSSIIHGISAQNSIPNKSIKLNSKQVISRKSPQIIAETSVIPNRVSKINKTTGKLIITVGVTSSSDDDDYMFDYSNEKPNKNTDSNYDDNASPMSFQMDSPCYSPYSNVLITDNKYNEDTEKIENVKNFKNLDEESTVLVKSTNDVFQAKLDKFLKNARTQVELEKKAEKTCQTLNLEPKTPVSKIVKSTNTISVTPIAVRHLPESSQLEYRMLINRMKILERQKQIKYQQLNEQNNDNKSELIEQIDTKIQIIKKINAEDNDSTDINRKTETSEPNLNITVNVEQKLDENENSTIIPENDMKSNTDNQENNEQNIDIIDRKDKTKQNLELLKKYETAHDKNSTLILENLNRALKFVKLGKEVKTRKVLLESKLEKLKTELKLCETDLKLQNQKIAKIYPAISKSYDTIVHLKARRSKLSKVSKQLGKTLNENTQILKEGLSIEIQNKFKHLSNEINHLKNLKITDIENSEKELQKDFKSGTEICPSIDVENDEKSIDTEAGHNVGICEKRDIKNADTDINAKDTCKERLTENINQTLDQNHFESTNSKTSTSEFKYMPLNQEEPIYDETRLINVLTESAKENFDVEYYKYISPLEFLNERENSGSNCKINPNEILCPFQLMGQCDDKDCKYNHLNIDCSSEQIKQ